MLMKLERDKMAAKVESLQKQLQQYEHKDDDAESQLPTIKTRKQRDAPWPMEKRTNPLLHQTIEPFNTSDMKCQKRFQGHQAAITKVRFHPKLAVIGTASDDHTWKLWSSP